MSSRYYKSKESFLRLSNPLFKVYLWSIIECTLLKNEMLPASKKREYHYFCLKLNEKCILEENYRELISNGKKNINDISGCFIANKYIIDRVF